jgi:hypothetical protein
MAIAVRYRDCTYFIAILLCKVFDVDLLTGGQRSATESA